MRRLLPLVIALLAALVHLARLPRAAWDTMYAEDGFTFLQDSVAGTATWLTPYDGYQHLLPRIAATAISHLLPIEWWANAMILATALVVGAIAGLAFWVARDLIGSWIVAAAAAAYPVLVPVAGIEGIANMSNVHSFMPYAGAAALLARPRTRWGVALLSVGVAVIVLTDIQTILLVPLAVLVAVFRRRAAVVPLMAYAGALAVQLMGYLSVGRESGSTRPEAIEVVRGYLFDGVVGAFMGRVGVARTLVDVVSWWGLALLLVAWVIALAVILRSQPVVAAGSFAVLGASMASWALAHYYLHYPALNLLEGPFKLARWGTAPALLLLATTLPVIWVGLRAGRTWRMLTVGAALVVLAVQSLSLVLPTSRTGVYWSTEVQRGASSCRGDQGVVDIPILPGDAKVSLPCSAVR